MTRVLPFINEYPELRQNTVPVSLGSRGNRKKRKESFVEMEFWKNYLVTGPNDTFYIAKTRDAI